MGRSPWGIQQESKGIPFATCSALYSPEYLSWKGHLFKEEKQLSASETGNEVFSVL